MDHTNTIYEIYFKHQLIGTVRHNDRAKFIEQFLNAKGIERKDLVHRELITKIIEHDGDPDKLLQQVPKVQKLIAATETAAIIEPEIIDDIPDDDI